MLTWLAIWPLQAGFAEEPQTAPASPQSNSPEQQAKPEQPSQAAPQPPQAPPQPAQSTTPQPPSQNPADVTFTVTEYRVDGNTVLSDEKIKAVVAPYVGPDRRVKDVEKVRLALEKAYRDAGYPTVLVVVPEQTVEAGVVQLKVIESKLGEISVTGNRYFSTLKLLDALPSLRPGTLLYEPEVLKELDHLNEHQDLKVTPVLQKGEEPGTVNLELKVVDRLPLHGSLELNSQGTPNTPRYQLNATIQYNNFMTPNRFVSIQTTQTPQHLGDVQLYGINYVTPLPWTGQTMALYAAVSNSISAISTSVLTLVQQGGGIGITGNAVVFGGRYILSTTTGQSMSHQLFLGVDFKFLGENDLTAGGTTTIASNEVTYIPLSVAYVGQLFDRLGMTKLSVTLRGNIGGILPLDDDEAFGGDPSDPYNEPGNRAGADATFGVFQAGLERSVNLPQGFLLSLKADGQVATQPLIPAEQYAAGGINSVRGYWQNEVLGDNAVHGTVELVTPPFEKLLPASVTEELRMRIFYDAAYLWLKSAPPGQTEDYQLEGSGFGIQLKLTDHLLARVDQAWAWKTAVVTKKGDYFTHFSIQTVF